MQFPIQLKPVKTSCKNRVHFAVLIVVNFSYLSLTKYVAGRTDDLAGSFHSTPNLVDALGSISKL